MSSEINTFFKKDHSKFNAVIDAHGLYSTEQFVVRLSPKNHQLLEENINGKDNVSYLDPESIRAYSTLIHENIHWWQHIGSTTGVVMSLCMPMQTQLNHELLIDFVSLRKPVKPIKKFALNGEKRGKTGEIYKKANAIVNNTFDLVFYKDIILRNKASTSIKKNPYFLSKGHSFRITYSTICSMFEKILDKDSNLFHNAQLWNDKFDKLETDFFSGYYLDSPVPMGKIGVYHLFEGQACFSQLQFLAYADPSGGDSLSYFEDNGILHGVYKEAFDLFIEKTGFEKPLKVTDPIIDLFLLVCDLSINPMEGFPCDIVNFDRFIYDSDPGVRFDDICKSISSTQNISTFIPINPNKDEYFRISSLISSLCGFISPFDGWSLIKKWIKTSKEISNLQEAYRTLSLGGESTVIKLIFSAFIEISVDKLNCPEFFCWPGHWMNRSTPRLKELWLKHLSLFTDAEYDDGALIRNIPGIPQENHEETINHFYAHVVAYELTYQWIMKEKRFLHSFKWVSENISEDEWIDFSNDIFKKLYGVELSSIKVI